MLELQGVVEADTTLIGYNRSHTIIISSLSHYMSHFIFLEDTSIVFSTLRCMRLEKLGFEQNRINPINRSFCLFSPILGLFM